MSKIGSASFGPFLVGGYNFMASTLFDVTGPSVEAVTEETHGLGDAWAEHLAIGQKRVTLSHNGLYDDDVAEILDALNGQQMVQRIVVIGYEGNVLGKPFVGLTGAFGSTVSRVSSRGALHRLSATYTGTGQADDGVIVQPLATITFTGATTGASVDNLASSAGGGVGYLEVTALTGFTDVDAVIQDSADNSIFATLIAFNNLPAAPYAARSTVGSTINRYTRMVVTTTGTGSVTLMAGLKRNA